MKKRELLKRLAAFILGGVMTFSLTACGSTGNGTSGGDAAGSESQETENVATKEETGTNTPDDESGEPTEISIAIWNADAVFAGDDVLNTIEDKLNIKITPMNVTWDDYIQKIQLWELRIVCRMYLLGISETA